MTINDLLKKRQQLTERSAVLAKLLKTTGNGGCFRITSHFSVGTSVDMVLPKDYQGVFDNLLMTIKDTADRELSKTQTKITAIETLLNGDPQ